MAVFQGFVGPSGVVRSPNVNAEATVNLFLEAAPGTPKVSWNFYGTPGINCLWNMGGGPCRGMFSLNGTRLWVVMGVTFYELFDGGSGQVRGYVASDGGPVTFACSGSNSFQIVLASAGLGYVYDIRTNAFSQISATGFPSNVVNVDYCDGFFLALKGQSNEFHRSALLDGSSWDAADAFQMLGSSNQVSRLLVNREQDIWLFGTETLEVWQPTGGVPVFAPGPGLTADVGIAAPFSACRVGDTVIWVGQNTRGAGVVYRSQGYQPAQISTRSVETSIQGNPRLSEATAYTYQQDGHGFYVLGVPGNPTAWRYDLTTGQWTEDGKWNPVTMVYDLPRPNSHAYCFGKHLVGDRYSGAIYEQRLDLTINTVPA